MIPVQVEGRAIREELKRVLDSLTFARQERLSQFLQFIIERTLEGRHGELKESVIGNEIFGHRPDYNPKADPIVRTEARRLRALLNEYYVGDGKDDSVIIEVPKGGYVPVFRERRIPEEPAPGPAPPARRTPPRLKIALVLAALPIAVASTGWWLVHRQNVPIPIAVLPLMNLSQEADNEYFADGLTSEIIRNLSIIEGLAVRSQTSSFVFKGKPRNVREAGKQLDAEYILEGSVLREGQQLRINAQLVRVRDDFPLWSARYDRELADIFAVQDEISRGIVNSLRLKLGRGRRRYETSVEAYDLYLRGRSLEMLPGISGMEASFSPYQEAIAKDAAFAPAYAGLAAAHAVLSGFDRFDSVERSDEIANGWAAARKAIELDPLLAEARDAMGIMYAREAKWDQAERSFRRAITLAPADPLWRHHFALFLLFPLARIEEALRELRIAEKADPLSPALHFSLREGLRSIGRLDEAEADCQKMAVTDLECSKYTLSRQGKFDEFARIAESRWRDRLLEAGAGTLGVAYAKAGRRTDAEWVAAIVPRPMAKAAIFAALGDKDRALDELDGVVPLGPLRVGWALMNPEFALLRGDPRLQALRRKVGLPQ